MWATPTTMASLVNNTTTGWTISGATSTGSGTGLYWKLINSSHYIESPAINWNQYTSIKIKIKARTYGGVTAANNKISVSQGSTELTSYTPTSTTLTYSSELSISPSSGALRIACLGANGSKGSGISEIIITGEPVAITSIAFSEPKTASVGVGGTVTLNPTILPSNYGEAVDWESDDTDVATVNSAGVVTGVATGTAQITAKSHSNPTTIYDVCTVSVTAPIAVTGVSLKSSTTLLLGGTETLVPSFSPADATNKNVSWSSADDSKVSVDEDGVITGLALTGGSPVNITVTTEDGSFKATCAVTVNPVPVASVGLDKTSAKLVVGKTLTLSETVLPDNATNKSVTWESDDEDVATVNSSGKVTAVAEGTATITVKSVADPTKSTTCTVTVTDGSIDLSTTGEITFGSWSTSILGSSYGDRECALPGSDGNTYYWNEVDGYYNSGGWQIKKTTGKVTSPTIKSDYGFTISTTKGTYNVTISDGTNSGQNSLTTTKTNTAITIQGDGTYAVFTAITITPLKAPVATDVTITDPGTLAKDATGTFAYTATAEEDNTASWTSATTGVITITNAATGAYTAAGRGTSKITLTLTPTDATTYDAVKAERTVTVTVPVEVSADDVEMTYGDNPVAISATTSAGYAGTLTYASGNTSIATVDASGNVTAVAAGTTTITISAPADASHYYTAGDDVKINVTVSAPEGGTTAKTTTPVVVASNTLLSSSLPTGWTGDGAIWSGSSSYGAVASSGTDDSTYDLKTATINLNGNYSAASVTFQHTGKTFSTPSNACNLYVKDGDTETQLTIDTYFAGDDWTYVSNTTALTSYIGKSIQLIFRYTPASGDNGKWEVKNFAVNATPSPTESVTLNASGYATFCSKYPLDFSKANAEDKGFTAWQITDANSTTGVITFTQITGKIKGGQGILLKGTANATVTITSDDSSNELGSNILFGTTAPTCVAADTYYGLRGDEFVPVNAGTVPAGKALLPVSEVSSSVKAFVFVFEDDADGINMVNGEGLKVNGPVYDLQGRRVEKPGKGLYIVNGKKVLY